MAINNIVKTENTPPKQAEKPATINTASQQPNNAANNWQNILPPADAQAVQKIICNYTTELDLHGSFGVPLVAIEDKARNNPSPQPAAKTKATEPKISPTVPAPNVEITSDALLKNPESTKQVSRLLKLNDNAKKDEVAAELAKQGLAKDGKILNAEFFAKSQARWDGVDGKSLQSLDTAQIKYIQTMIGTTDDGVVGPKTLEAAQKAGIINENGTLNESKIKENTLKIYNDKYSTKEAAKQPEQPKLDPKQAALDAARGMAGVSPAEDKAAIVPVENQNPKINQPVAAR